MSDVRQGFFEHARNAMQLELPLRIADFIRAAARPRECRGALEGSRDEQWTSWCADTARGLQLPRLAAMVEVRWNPRLVTTAGFADCRSWRVELNPRLVEFAPAEPARTLRHELAHLVAQARAGRRRIATHGVEWRRACADLGIPGERACHRLPLPRRSQKRQWAYRCPACGSVYERVRRMRYAAACADCCRAHNRGRFTERFRLRETALRDR